MTIHGSRNTYETCAVVDYISRHRRRRATRLYYSSRYSPRERGVRRESKSNGLEARVTQTPRHRRSSRAKFVRARRTGFSTFRGAIRRGGGFHRTFGSSVRAAPAAPRKTTQISSPTIAFLSRWVYPFGRL